MEKVGGRTERLKRPKLERVEHEDACVLSDDLLPWLALERDHEREWHLLGFEAGGIADGEAEGSVGGLVRVYVTVT